LKALGTLLGLVYPLLVFAGLTWLSPRALAVLIGAVLLIRAIVKFRGTAWRRLSPLFGAAGIVAGLVALAALFDDGRYFQILPVVVNVGLLMSFARTLWSGPSMVETLARLHHRTLPSGGPAYCRRVTIVWCGFFAANAAVILWLALAASLETWTLYTGLLAYLLVGVLFAMEALYRAWRFRHYEDGLADAVLRRIFPPRVSA